MAADSKDFSSGSRRAASRSERLRERLRTFPSRIKRRARVVRQYFRSSDDTALLDRIAAIGPDDVAEGAKRITETDLDTVVDRADEIEDRFRRGGPLHRLLEDGRLLLELVRDARHGRYRRVPVWTLSAAAFALLYVLNPFDLVPDAVPLLGLLDDAAVVSACFALIEQDLYDYRAWRDRHLEEAPDEPDSLPEDRSAS